MRKKRSFLIVLIVLILIGLLTSCSTSDQLKRAYEDLNSGKPICATALLTGGNSKMGSETLYAQGADTLRIANGPNDSWQHVELFLDGDYYSNVPSSQKDPLEGVLSLYYNGSISKPDAPAPWFELRWEDIKDTIVSTEENDGVLKVSCEDTGFTTVYQLKDGQINSIAYTEIISYYDEDNRPAEAAFTKTYTFHEIEQQKVSAIFVEYLEKAENGLQ